ncbi:uncharacterized protein PY1_contig-01-54 [Novosphingobium sp. PY1]|nr:uncharacterized protein PY1_contig-01-54 [Novosphingobium sp. PY1]
MQLSSFPTLSNTVAWMAPLIRHLQESDVQQRPFQKHVDYRRLHQPVVMTLTDEPIKAVTKVMPLYATREKQLADALTTALGAEWLVQPVLDRTAQRNQAVNYIGGNVADGDVVVCPYMTAFIYDLQNGFFVPGKSKKSGAQFEMRLHARRFESPSDKLAYLICK